MFELSDVITPTGKEIRFEFKKFESNGIRVIQRDYEELIRQTLLGIEKSSSKDYFELSRIRVKRRQLYKYTPHKLWNFEWNFWKVFCKGVPFW